MKRFTGASILKWCFDGTYYSRPIRLTESAQADRPAGDKRANNRGGGKGTNDEIVVSPAAAGGHDQAKVERMFRSRVHVDELGHDENRAPISQKIGPQVILIRGLTHDNGIASRFPLTSISGACSAASPGRTGAAIVGLT